MQHIADFFEAKFANSNKRYAKSGTPDVFTHTVRGIEKEYKWRDSCASAFIYNIKNDKVIWGEAGDAHYDLIDSMSNKEKQEMGMEKIQTVTDLRWDWFEDYDDSDKGKRKIKNEIKKWSKDHPEADYIYLGRLWHAHEGKKWVAYIVWWNELDKSNFVKFNNRVVKDYNETKGESYGEPKIIKYRAIDNNGNFKNMNVNDNKEKSIEARSEETKDNIKVMRAIHLATQEEKREYFKAWREQHARLREKELQKLGIRDGTYAKRNNMFAKHTVYDKETGKYKVVYGAKIGDSLQIKSLKNYITENS